MTPVTPMTPNDPQRPPKTHRRHYWRFSRSVADVSLAPADASMYRKKIATDISVRTRTRHCGSRIVTDLATSCTAKESVIR